LVKLLVVDDEITSRDSLIRNIMKMDFDISFIEQADDGVRALETAAWYFPDIVLTDVRMPRMDGIEMSYKLREMNPDIKIIFLSGYSDKEYLKSAIQLRALSYVEKPIDYEELKKVMSEAISLIIVEQKNRKNADIHERLVKNLPLLRNEIAIKMINPVNISEEQFDYTLLGIKPDSDFVTVLIQIISNNSITSFGFYLSLENTISCINNVLKSKELAGLATVKDNEYILLHIACTPDRKHLLRQESLQAYLSQIPIVLESIDFFIAVGIQVSGIQNVSKSYNTAVLALQMGFFTGYRNFLFYIESTKTPYTFNEEIIKDFNQHVFKEDTEKAITLINNLVSDLRQHNNTLVDHIKEFFYRILLQLFDLADELILEVFYENNNRSHLWENLNAFHTLFEVEEFTIQKIEFFFKCRKEKRDNRGKISQIIRFIENNYMRHDLSVKMISEHTFISLAYMCSIFKLETERTINQHLTDYRIEKAKELLKDKSYKISEVAECVGFSDGQYFAKIFKKKLFLTPSEYREAASNEK